MDKDIEAMSPQMRKYEMLKSYNAQRKSILPAALLLALAGFSGAHRLIRKDYMRGLAILLIWAVVLIFYWRTKNQDLLTYGLAVYGLFLVVEYYLLTRYYDKADARLKAELARKYRV
ncbi:MAG TPA: hypothetical protein ENK01_04440 [Hellea balneolensis]|uniref:TM2 domain-containing protein n=1 Tax=Hellea balneolensis TaxID=287478 RepID=A0A7V5NXP2_9PROT|nr:hypothetical protein [Hellea balneolensis]